MNRRVYRVSLTVRCQTCDEQQAIYGKQGDHGQRLVRDVLDQLRAEGWRLTTSPKNDRCPSCSAIAAQYEGSGPLI